MPIRLPAILLLLVLAPAATLAQGPEREPKPDSTRTNGENETARQAGASDRSLRFTIDNDLFAMRAGKPDDHDYTHGTHVLISSAGAPGWLRHLVGGLPACRSAELRKIGCLAGSLRMGQEIYTPRLEGVEPVPGERPYSGWLFIAPGLHHVAAGRVRSLTLLLGVTGPASLAEKAQDGIHALLGEHERRGWRHQLRSEVGAAIAYDDRVGAERGLGGSRVGALSLGWGAVAGNVRTALHAGAVARVGLARDLPWSPEELESSAAMRVYALGGFRQELVLRDLFVDGNTFHESSSADRIALVQQIVLGLGVRHDGYALEYRWVRRGREYEAQAHPHAWGSVGFIVHWQ